MPGFLLIARHGGDGAEGDSSLDLPALTGSYANPKTGIAVRWPDGWEQRRRNGAVALRSPDRNLVITISTPGPAKDADQVRGAAIASTRDEYKRATVQHGKGRTVGGRRAAGALIEGTRSGARVRILIAVAKGRERAYLLQVLSAPDTPSGTLLDGQLVLRSIELSR